MMVYTNDQRCDKISVNNVNVVIQQQIASGKHCCISTTKALVNVYIGMMVKLNTPKINQHCDKISVNHVNLVKNSLRQILLYLTNRSSTKCENWCDGKV